MNIFVIKTEYPIYTNIFQKIYAKIFHQEHLYYNFDFMCSENDIPTIPNGYKEFKKIGELK